MFSAAAAFSLPAYAVVAGVGGGNVHSVLDTAAASAGAGGVPSSYAAAAAAGAGLGTPRKAANNRPSRINTDDAKTHILAAMQGEQEDGAGSRYSPITPKHGPLEREVSERTLAMIRACEADDKNYYPSDSKVL